MNVNNPWCIFKMITTVCVIVHTDEDSQVQAEELTSKKLCFKCQSSNHESRNCPGSGAGKKIHALKIQDNTKFDRFKVETGACPVCKAEFHTWKKYGSGFDLVSNQLKDCPTFLGLATGKRREWLTALRSSLSRVPSLCLFGPQITLSSGHIRTQPCDETRGDLGLKRFTSVESRKS